MAAPVKSFLQRQDRRYFLWSLAGLGLSPKLLQSENRSEVSYHFLTSECEVRMSVQFLANSSAEGFYFRDRLTNRAFCLSANGEENQGWPGAIRRGNGHRPLRLSFTPSLSAPTQSSRARRDHR
jgi:hypothetical protein